jgi:hypothetical protein
MLSPESGRWPEGQGAHSFAVSDSDMPQFDSSDGDYDWLLQGSGIVEGLAPADMVRVDKRIYTIHESDSEEEEQRSLTSSETGAIWKFLKQFSGTDLGQLLLSDFPQ